MTVVVGPSAVRAAVPAADQAPVLLTGWGRTAASAARLVRPSDVTELAAAVAGDPARAVLGRGLGRSYGDAAQSAGGLVLDTGGLAGFDVDPEHGLLTADAGCDLDALLRALLPLGWFVPVTPGTRFVSLGGAIAADVHGKNHHVDGTFGQHVAWLELMDGAGLVRRVSPHDDPDAFWATVGGMGLTGVIVRAALRLVRVPSAWMTVRTERARDLAGLLDQLRGADRRWRYTVAWVDCLSTGRSFGRGVITSGDHADAATVHARTGADPLAYAPRPRLTAPTPPLGLVTPATARAFNEAWFRRAPHRPHQGLQRLATFFHPLDGVRDWNRLYGPRGFLQYQFVVPDERADLVERALGELRTARCPAFLAVLKRFGPADPAPLSFPRPGWTLAVDIPASGGESLGRVLDGLDVAVAEAGGAIYLAKDARLAPDLLTAMYPRLPQWRDVRDRLDPERRFASDLSRRLQL